MKEIQLTTTITLFENLEELPNDIQLLMKEAVKVRKTAYAPYSHFNVGVALLLENGEIVKGNNQENAAYPSGMCAERVAIWQAASRFPNIAIKQIVITASSINKVVNDPVGPCGACRQSLLEYEVNQSDAIEIYFMGETGTILKANSIKDLLPLSFDKTLL